MICPQTETSAIETRLRDVMPDALSPREALDLIYELKNTLDD